MFISGLSRLNITRSACLHSSARLRKKNQEEVKEQEQEEDDEEEGRRGASSCGVQPFFLAPREYYKPQRERECTTRALRRSKARFPPWRLFVLFQRCTIRARAFIKRATNSVHDGTICSIHMMRFEAHILSRQYLWATITPFSFSKTPLARKDDARNILLL